MLGFWIVLATGAGLSLLLPRIIPKHLGIEWIGARLLIGLVIIPICLYLGNMVLGIPLHWVAWVLIATALCGWGKLIGSRGSFHRVLHYSWHPLLWLLALFPLAVLWHDGVVNYLTVLVDENNNWLGWARQMVVTDQTKTTKMTAVPVYLPGWTYFLAFPGLVVGVFEVHQVSGILFVFHVALLGLLCDLVNLHLEKISYWESRLKKLFVWAFILIFLTMETSWKLVPTNVMSERPQFYLISACFLLGWATLCNGPLRLRLSIIIGIFLSAAYMVKTAAIVLVPALVILALIVAYKEYKTHGQESGVRAFYIIAAQFLPFLIIYLSWHFISSFSCNANPSLMFILTSMFEGQGNHATDLAMRFGTAIFGYASNYKLPLTILALSGLAFAAFGHLSRWVVVGLLVYTVLYVLALYWVYLTCYQGYSLEILSSHQRYARVVLRTIHIIGVFFAAITVIEIWEVFRKQFRKKIGNTSLLVTAGLFLVCALFGWQIISSVTAVREMNNRFEFLDYEWVKMVQAMNHQAPRLLNAMTNAESSIEGDLMIIAQDDRGNVRSAVRAAISGRRRGDQLMPFRIRPEYRFASTKETPWTKALNSKQLKSLFMAQKALWPLTLDLFTRDILKLLINPKLCKNRIEDYFLIRTASNKFPFRCVPKNYR